MEAPRPRPRPRFELESELGAQEVVRRVHEALKHSKQVVGLTHEGRLELTVPNDAQHLWSPQLIVDVEERDSGSLLRARFGPHPAVWTMYIALCAVLVIVAMLALAFGFSQWLIDQTPWALWVAPGAAVLAALAFGAAFVGQGLSSEQMYELRAFLDRTLELEP